MSEVENLFRGSDNWGNIVFIKILQACDNLQKKPNIYQHTHYNIHGKENKWKMR